MKDTMARAMAKQANDAVQGSLNIIESTYVTELGGLSNSLSAKVKTTTPYVATASGITNISHGLTYESLHDELCVYWNGYLLVKTTNYTDATDYLSVNLVGWSLDVGDTVSFILYKNVK